MLDFKKIYSLPLMVECGMVFTSDGERAFDFSNSFYDKDSFMITESSQEKIIKVINGASAEIQTDLKLDYSANEAIIYTRANGRKQQFIVIRGWGHLIGTGGLNLPEEDAIKIQDDFAAYIIEKLSK